MLRIILALAFVLAGCMAGEDGDDGKDGADGLSRGQKAYTGVLYSADAKTQASGTYWDLTYFSLTDSSIVSVFVRQGSGFMWQIPTWYLGDAYVRILDDEKVSPAYEYKVVIGN